MNFNLLDQVYESRTKKVTRYIRRRRRDTSNTAIIAYYHHDDWQTLYLVPITFPPSDEFISSSCIRYLSCEAPQFVASCYRYQNHYMFWMAGEFF